MDLFMKSLLTTLLLAISSCKENETVLYYYGLEESERGLPRCEQGQACSAIVWRYWRPRALLRLCRCERRQRCDEPATAERLVELNNRAYLQFCNPTTELPACTLTDKPLSVETSYKRMNPDEIEELHHENKHLTPPKVILTCRCHYPNYWKLKNEEGHRSTYQCSSLPLCKTGDVCGNVDDDSLALYQSCLCPRNHICVHNGGLPQLQISELMYRGKGWRAICQPVNDDYSYENV